MRLAILACSFACLSVACDKTDDPDMTLKCGEQLSCASDEICVEDRFDPACSTPQDGGTCPQGTTAGQCGGAGVDCCCPPDPPSEYRCESASACGGEPSCVCLPMLCPDNKDCAQLDEGSPLFACETPPAP
jgi:hypothetical protein